MPSLFKLPNFPDENQARSARLLRVILLAFLAVLTPLYFIQAAFSIQDFERWLALILAIDLLALVLLDQLRRRHVRRVSWTIVGFAWFYLLVATLASGGPRSQTIWFNLVVVLLAGILLGERAGLLTALGCCLSTLFVWLVDASKLMPPSIVSNPPVDFWIVFIFSLLAVTFLQHLATRSIHESLARANHELAERRQVELALRESEAALRANEAELRESNDLLRAIVDVSPLSITMMDLDGRMQLWNPASERVFGWTAEEVLNGPNPIVPAERWEEFAELSRQLFEDDKISEIETQRRRKDGSLIDVSLSSAVIYDAEGRKRARMAIIADITGHKQTEMALIESNRRLNTTINNLRGVVYRCVNDSHWTMEYISDGIQELTGYPAADFINDRVRTLNSITEPEYRPMVVKEIERALARRQPYMLEYRMRTASGEQIWAWERGRGVFDGDTLVALEGFISDITDRKNTEEEARIEQQRLNSLLLISQKKTGSVVEMLQCALEEICALSGSQYGYIFLYNEEKEEFSLHVWSKEVMKDCHLTNPHISFPLDEAGIWGEVVRQGGPIILNDFSKPHPLKKGYPAGHAPISRFMSLPVFDGERIVAVVGVANKPENYTDLDLRQLDMMMDVVWKIAERKQAESALRESEHKFRAFIEQNSEGVVLVDEQGCVIEWNQAMTNITGFTPDQVVGRLFWEVQIMLMRPERRTAERVENIKNYMMEVQRTGQAHRFNTPSEIIIQRADGEQAVVQQIVFPIKTASGCRLGSLARDITERKRSEQQIEALNADLLAAYDATIEGWAAALELRDRETEGHSRRVVGLTLELARRMGIPECDLVHLRRGAILHDIGKMGIPDSILLKPGKLTDEERDAMCQHPVYAFVMLLGIPFLRQAVDIPYAHHERWDGKGYPRGLKGEDIPLPARLFAVVDVWDALLSERSYRPAWTRAEAIRYLEDNAGQQFDPAVVQAFLEMVEE